MKNSIKKIQDKKQKKFTDRIQMLISRDPNTQSAPIFLKVKDDQSNDVLEDHTNRKPILKKHLQNKKQMKKQADDFRKSIKYFNQENKRFKVSIAVDQNVKESKQNSIRGPNKKKSTFFQQLNSSQKSKSKNKSRKMTHLSTGSDKTSLRIGNASYKQSRIDIIFSSSDIQQQMWNPIEENIIDSVQEQKQEEGNEVLQSSDVFEVKVDQQPFGNQIIPKINLKIVDKYQNKNSDRIMQQISDRSSKASKILTQKHTISTGIQSQHQSNLKNFKKSLYYEGFQEQKNESENDKEFETIVKSPSVKKQLKSKQNLKLSRFKTQKNNMEMTKTSNTQLQDSRRVGNQICQQKIAKSRQRLQQILSQSVYKYPEELGFSMNYTDSNVISKSTYMSRVDKSLEFRQQMFAKINLYRFLNRLQYKISKFLSFQSNQLILATFIDQIIRKKCYILLNAEIQLESLTKSTRKYDEKDRQIFLQIIHAYIEKESLMPYWKQVKKDFQKVSFLSFTLRDTGLYFLKQTLPEVQRSLQSIKGKIDRGVIQQQTILFQLQLKIIKYLYYDCYKINVTEHSHPSSIRNTPFNKQRRLRKIIEQDQWFEKIPFKQLVSQFNFLKQDLRNQCHQVI